MLKQRWISLVIGALLLSGCGEFVKFDGRQPDGGTAVVLDGFPETTRLNHLLLDALLSRFTVVSPDNAGFALVDYDALKNDVEARFLLDQYLGMLAAVDANTLESPAERLAYWINAYNAAVLKGIITNYGGDKGFSTISNNGIFFDQPAYTFGGVVMSLNQLEHGVLRGDKTHSAYKNAPAETRSKIDSWNQELWDGQPLDPRLHMAINCAAISCPNLVSRAFTAQNLESQLDAATREFIKNPQKGAGENGISMLFAWFSADFTHRFGGVPKFIEQHRENGLNGVVTNKFLAYDWTLNIVGNKP